MKQLQIQRIALNYFKGIRQAKMEFRPDVTTIIGDNGTGKSTIADAFAWLLFGKNAAGDSDQRFSIKTLEADGNFIPDLNHEVSADFRITDTATGEIREISLRRALVEDWRTAPGETERVLRGHHTDYFFNDIPVKKSEYDSKVAEIIPAEVFRLITDPAAFLAQPWEQQRAQLTAISGADNLDTAAIAAGVQDFERLLQRIKGVTLEQYRAGLLNEKKRLEAELVKIPTRIDEVQRSTPLTPDFAELEARKAELEAREAGIIKVATDVAERQRVKYEAAQSIRQQIDQLQDELMAMTQKAVAELQNLKFDREQAISDGRRALSAIDREINFEQQQAQFSTIDRELASIQSQIADLEAKQEAARAEYRDIAARPYDPDTFTCPLFRHRCTDPTACSANGESFNTAKVQDLKRRQREGRERNEQLAELRQRLETLTAEKTAQQQQRAAKLEELNQRRADEAARLEALQALAPITSDNLKVEDIPGHAEKSARLEELRRQYNQATDTGVEPQQPATDSAELQSIRRELDEVKRRLGLRIIIEQMNTRVEELHNQTRELAQNKAEIERELATVTAYSVAIDNAIEEQVNRRFKAVKFRLFKTLVNGTRQPDCIATVNGVKYSDVNTAGRINAGMDIIDALTHYHNFSAPIFVDNCESVAKLYHPADAQIIQLKFVKGSPLQLEEGEGAK